MMIKSFIPRKISLWLLLLAMGLITATVNVTAQETEPEEEAVEEKATARLSLQYINLMEEQRLVATVKSKIDKSYENIPGVKVNFYKDVVDNDNLLGSINTNGRGKAIFILPAVEGSESPGEFTYVATIENNLDYEDAEEEIYVKSSVIHMELEEEDSTRYVKIFIGTPDAETGEMLPAPDVEVKIFVQRLFGLLPILEDAEMTDEEGYVTVEFPSDIPGGKEGNLVIVAKVEDHEEYGNIEFRKKIAWGIPLATDNEELSRELWSARANAPLSLVFLVNSVLVGVWGFLIYIVYQMYGISKIGKQSGQSG